MSDDDPRSGAPCVAVLADDLIWSTRLVDGIRRAGGIPVAARDARTLDQLLPRAQGALIDLTSRAYDGLAAVSSAHAAGVPVVAVGQHDDVELRRAAKAAGAARVHAYRALFEHGDRELGGWLASLGTGPEGDR